MCSFFLLRWLRFSSLPDDLLQEINVVCKCLSSSRGQRTSGQGPLPLKGFCHRHEPGLLQSFDVHTQIAIGHIERVAQICERKFGRSGQKRHDRQAPLLVNDAIDLEERFWIHAAFPRFSVKYKYKP